MDAIGNHPKQSNDFQLHDFIDDQFIDLIRGENEDPFPTFDCRVISGCCDDNYTTPDSHLFDRNAAESTEVTDHNNFVLNSLTLSSSKVGGEVKEGDHYDEDKYGNDASGATTTTTATIINASSKKPKDDRSRTRISEHKRRGKMKEKLYELRALVPNITKMDKASIVGDAVSYVQELQMKAKNLKAEIACLEQSSTSSKNWKESIANTKNTQVQRSSSSSKKIIMQMDVFQVEERGFYLRLVSNKGEGVAGSLYKALE